MRPPALLAAREDFKEGRIDAQELRGIEGEAIRDVVRKQEEVGLQSADFADPEFNRRADRSLCRDRAAARGASGA